MLISLTALSNREEVPASDIGFLVAKHPDRLLEKGDAKVYFSEVSSARATLVYELNLNPMTYAKASGEAYVTYTPYTATAAHVSEWAQIFRTALQGKLKERYELLDVLFGWEVTVSAIRNTPERVRSLFEPLGYEVELIEKKDFTESVGKTRSLELRLKHPGIQSWKVFRHLYVLLIALDPAHQVYDLSQQQKLVREASGWLGDHPQYQTILRLLNPRKNFVADFVEALAIDSAPKAEETVPDPELTEGFSTTPATENDTSSLGEERRQWILDHLNDVPVGGMVVDAGSASAMLGQKFAEANLDKKVLAIDPSFSSLRLAKKFTRHLQNVEVVQGALGYVNLGVIDELTEVAAIVASEVIEHIDFERVPHALHSMLSLRPQTILLTVPNKEYNVLFDLEPSAKRHGDHRWEPTRQEFQELVTPFAEAYGYATEYTSISSSRYPEHPEYGGPTYAVALTRQSEEPLAPVSPQLEAVVHRQAAYHPEGGTSPNGRPFLIPRGQRIVAFENWTRFIPPPTELPYLPPTMAPGGTSDRPGFLEHLEDAFAYYRERGQKQVVCQEKHMGSRAIAYVKRDGTGYLHTRTGRHFFHQEPEKTHQVLQALATAFEAEGYWDRWISNSTHAIVDGELLPWSEKAAGLISRQFVAVGECGVLTTQAKLEARTAYNSRGLETTLPVDVMVQSLDDLQRYTRALHQYIEAPGSQIRFAPFHILGIGNDNVRQNFFLASNELVIEALNKLAVHSPLLTTTSHFVVDLADETACATAVESWLAHTEAGGEGYVVKPIQFCTSLDNEVYLQPAVKVRGREYLRIIYGPTYTQLLDDCKKRGLKGKRYLALNQFALGCEALKAWASFDLQKMQENVFAVLASSLEPLDPRL